MRKGVLPRRLLPQPRHMRQQRGMSAQDIPDHFGSGVSFGAKTGGRAAALQKVPRMPRIALSLIHI